MDLLEAIRSQRVETVQAVLAKGTSVEQRSEALFHTAYTHGYEDIALALLDAGVDPQWRDDSGRTLAHAGANRGLERVMERLLALGIDPLASDQRGITALHCAGSYGTVKIAEWLLARGAVVDGPNPTQITPLHEAALTNNFPVAKLLVDRGASLHRSVARGGHYVSGTPLHFAMAIQHHNEAFVKFLVERGSDTKALNDEGWAPMHVAGSVHDASWPLKGLLDAGADVNFRDKKGMTALHWAAKRQSSRCAAVLINAGAHLDATMKTTARTPLHFAAETSSPEVLALLLEHGADRTLTTRDGKTPLAIAKAKKRAKAVALLEKKSL